MAAFEVRVGDASYRVDAPDENTAWRWAKQTHESAAPHKELKRGEVKGPSNQTGDIVSSSIIRGVAGIAGLPQDALSLLRAARNKAQGTNYPTPKILPGSQDIVDTVEKVSGTPLYKPESAPGSIAGASIEGATAGAPFGPLGMVVGGISGAGSEVAGQLTNNNPWARLAGGLVTGGAAGFLSSLRRPTGGVLKDLLNGTDDKTLIAAQKLIDEARARGVTLTGPEALAQVKNSPTAPILGVQRVVEQSRGGAPIMSDVMSQRPEQNRQAFQGVLNQVGPQVSDPTSIAPRVQTAAQGVVDDARQAGNAAASPFYRAAEGQTVPPSVWNNATSNPAIAGALEKVKADPLLGLQNERPGSVRWLDAAKKFLDESANPTPMASALERTGAANAGRAAADLRSSVDAVVPDYAKARSIVEQNAKNVVEPLKRQPTGQLAEATTFSAQRAILFPSNPETLTPQAVRTTISQLRMKDQAAARDLTRQFLETQFDEVTQALVKGGNEFGGAKFAAAITGNSKQAQNIRAAVESVGGKPALDGFNKFIQIMEAQGKRQPAGSATEFNKQITEELSRGGVTGNAATIAASPGKLITAISDFWARFQYGGNSKELAQIFTDPKSVDKMRQLSMLGKDSPKARALAASIVVPVEQAQ